MAKKTKKVLGAEEIAVKLAEVREKIKVYNLLNEGLTKTFREALANEGLRAAGGYRLNKFSTYKVAVEELALPFALQHNNAVKVDVTKIKEIFQLDAALNKENNPEKYGFEVVTSERVEPIRSQES